MTALQEMTGCDLDDEASVRSAIASLTPLKRQQLLAQGQELKRDLLTKQEHAEERSLYFDEVNRSADQAGLPVDKDGAFLAKKVRATKSDEKKAPALLINRPLSLTILHPLCRSNSLQIAAYMSTSNEEIPHLFLLEALASSPYLIKVALAEARDPAAASAAQNDLAEVEAALSVLKVGGWREGEAAGRPPFVRRNLLLLHAHLYRERLRALVFAESTTLACAETVERARRLLDMLLAYSLQVGWVRATMCITELQGLVTNGLWDPREDECRSHMKTKLAAVGLKLPKISLAGHCSDVAPGERVKLTVTLTRLHAHSPAEMAALAAEVESAGEITDNSSSQPEAPAQAPASQDEVPSFGGAEDGSAGDDLSGNRSLAEAFGGEAAALGKEGWWLVVESVRPPIPAALAKQRGDDHSTEPQHNSMVGRQALSPSLDDPQWCADIEFDAPSTPGEYKVIIHVRSSSMIGVDARRKVSFSVRSSMVKRSLPSSSSGTSTEGTEPCETMEAMDAAIAEIEEEACYGRSNLQQQQGSSIPEEEEGEGTVASEDTKEAAAAAPELQ